MSRYWEVWRALVQRLRLFRAQYLDIHTLTHELIVKYTWMYLNSVQLCAWTFFLWSKFIHCSSQTFSLALEHFSMTEGSLSNHGDDGIKNPTNLHIWRWKKSIFARFARAFFIFWHFVDVLVLSTTWNYLFCSWVDEESIWWQMFNFVFLCPTCWFQI